MTPQGKTFSLVIIILGLLWLLYSQKRPGRAIRNAAIRFGNGETLPFTPCKKGFIPMVGESRKFACPLHDKERRKRVQNEGGAFRKGEFDLNILWKRWEEEHEKDKHVEQQISDDHFSVLKKTKMTCHDALDKHTK